VKATTAAIVELADHLASQGIQRVVLESTSDYWRPFHYVLEARGLKVWLVNASQVKHAPGRPKSDELVTGRGRIQEDDRCFSPNAPGRQEDDLWLSLGGN
jgi:hypothetical protein